MDHQALKSLAKRVLGPKLVGALTYYRYPDRRHSWGGPFNGQLRRKDVFLQLLNAVTFDATIETGTYLGTTTDFLARAGAGAVYSVESDPRAYGFSRARLRKHKNVRVEHGDSRSAMRRWLDAGLRNKTMLFYLDAHWNSDLPLAEELELALSECPRAVVLIDDFCVPWDEGYGYDDYGPGKSLTYEYIEPVVMAHNAEVFFPAVPSTEETGARRGWTVVANHPELLLALSKIEGLRLYSLRPTDKFRTGGTQKSISGG